MFSVLTVHASAVLRVALAERAGLFASQHRGAARRARPSSAIAARLCALKASSGPLVQEAARKLLSSC